MCDRTLLGLWVVVYDAQTSVVVDGRFRALSVNAQTTTATARPGVSYLQQHPYAAVHHNTGLCIVNYNLKTQ